MSSETIKNFPEFIETSKYIISNTVFFAAIMMPATCNDKTSGIESESQICL